MFQKLGAGEIILIVGAALLIFGPKKLPELGKSLGQGIREFKKSMTSVTESITAEEQPKQDKA